MQNRTLFKCKSRFWLFTELQSICNVDEIIKWQRRQRQRQCCRRWRGQRRWWWLWWWSVSCCHYSRCLFIRCTNSHGNRAAIKCKMCGQLNDKSGKVYSKTKARTHTHEEWEWGREDDGGRRDTSDVLEWTIPNQQRAQFCQFNPMKIFVPFETYIVRLTFVKVWNWE